MNAWHMKRNSSNAAWWTPGIWSDICRMWIGACRGGERRRNRECMPNAERSSGRPPCWIAKRIQNCKLFELEKERQQLVSQRWQHNPRTNVKSDSNQTNNYKRISMLILILNLTLVASQLARWAHVTWRQCIINILQIRMSTRNRQNVSNNSRNDKLSVRALCPLNQTSYALEHFTHCVGQRYQDKGIGYRGVGVCVGG